MTMREDALKHLGAILDEPLATAGMLAEDSAGQLKEPLDATDRGMALVDLAEDDEGGRQSAYYALAELHTLLRIRRKIALRFDVGTGGDSYRLSQSRDKIDGLIAEARTQALMLAGAAAVNGIRAEVDDGGLVTGITLDWSGGSRPDNEYAR